MTAVMVVGSGWFCMSDGRMHAAPFAQVGAHACCLYKGSSHVHPLTCWLHNWRCTCTCLLLAWPSSAWITAWHQAMTPGVGNPCSKKHILLHYYSFPSCLICSRKAFDVWKFPNYGFTDRLTFVVLLSVLVGLFGLLLKLIF